MAGSWLEILAVGVAVGLAFALGPMLVDYGRVRRLLAYTDFDRIRFQQLLVTGGPEALAFPLSRKLSEKGILLSWRTQRELAKHRDHIKDYDLLAASLETYRETVGMLSERISVLAWHPGDEFAEPVPPDVAAAFRTIDGDWREFRRQSAFLHRFVQRYAKVRTQTF